MPDGVIIELNCIDQAAILTNTNSKVDLRCKPGGVVSICLSDYGLSRYVGRQAGRQAKGLESLDEVELLN